MSDKFEKLMTMLKALPVDTAYEQGLIEAAACGGGETYLIAGAQDADPFILLPLEEQLFEKGELPPFYVTAEYGEQFSLCAVNRNGEKELYRTASDFRRYCAGRFAEISNCTLQLPYDFLKRCSLRFAILDNISLAYLNEVGKGCAGCVMAIEADAGTLSDDYMTLCSYLAEERCISDKVALALYQRTTDFNDDMLAVIAAEVLNRESVEAFAYGDSSAPCKALEAAVGSIMAGESAGADDGVVQNCCGKAAEKLQTLMDTTKAEEAQYKKTKESYGDALSKFQAMADTEKYSLNNLLSDHEVEAIRSEIHDMFVSLEDALPELFKEVIQNSRSAKEDLKQLTGDYLGNLVNSFTECLLNQVVDEQLLPRTERIFESLCSRFSTVMRNVKLEQEDDISYAMAEFLKISSINLGNYHTQTAKTLSGIVQALARFALISSMRELELLNLGSAKIVDVLIDMFAQKLSDLIDALTPKGQYARSLRKELVEHLHEQEKLLCEQLENNILPRLYDYLQDEYTKLTGVYEKQLRDKEQHYAELQQSAAVKIASLQADIQAVEAMAAAV